VRSSITDPASGVREVKERAKRAIDQSTYPGAESREAGQEQVAKLVDNVDGDSGDVSMHIMRTGSPQYRSAFRKAITGTYLTNDEQRALSIGTGSAGGFAIPFTLDPTIIKTSSGVVNPLRRVSRNVTITGNTWKGVSSEGVTASYAEEGAEASDNAPTLAQPEVTVQRAQAFIPFSIEAGQDWSGMESEMTSLLADAKDKLEAEKFLSGSGTHEPFGLLTGATETVETAGTGAFVVGDLYNLESSLAPRFRANADFVGNRAIYNKIRQFDTAGGASLWVFLQQGIARDAAGNTGYQLLGYPANELSTMSSETTTTGQKTMVFGDFSQFLIVDRVGMQVELIPHTFGANGRPLGQRGFYAIWRNSSKVLTAKAFKVLKVK
jgi:HK97 family phage major capsid protein